MKATKLKIAKSKCDAVVERLLSMVVNEKFTRGSQLPTETELCEIFGVSRITVRESLKRLEMLNVVDIQQGKGTFVKEIGLGTFMQPMFNLIDFSEFDITTIYDSRQYIEIGTCRLAAANRTDKNVEVLNWLTDMMDLAVQHHELNRVAEIDREFHIEIAEASKNQILKAAVINLENISAACAKSINKSHAVMSDSVHHHRKIFKAIEMQDPDAAEYLIIEHTQKSKEFLL